MDTIDPPEMFANDFFPSFPAYSKRSSFFVITLEKTLIRAFTYNWRKTESQKFFMKLVKIINWAKINDQFQKRKETYIGKRLATLSENVPIYGEKLFGFTLETSPSLNDPTSLSSFNATRFRGLDFLYHIGSFDAGLDYFLTINSSTSETNCGIPGVLFSSRKQDSAVEFKDDYFNSKFKTCSY